METPPNKLNRVLIWKMLYLYQLEDREHFINVALIYFWLTQRGFIILQRHDSEDTFKLVNSEEMKLHSNV